MTIVAYVPDLMDRSKVASAAPGVTFARTTAELMTAAADASVIVVDLSRPGVLDALPALRASVPASARIIGFGSHVEREVLEMARAAGCDDVLARSAFFSHLAELLNEA